MCCPLSCISDQYLSSLCFFFCKQKTAYEMRISDWSSDVCSSDLESAGLILGGKTQSPLEPEGIGEGRAFKEAGVIAAGQFFQSLEVIVLANSESQAFGFVSQDSIHEFNAIIRTIGFELRAKAAGNRSFHAEAGTAYRVGEAQAVIRD